MKMAIQAALDAADETDAFLGITDVVFEKFSDQGFTQLTPSEQTIYCIDQFTKAMEYGGIMQFLRSDSGAFAFETLESLTRIYSKSGVELLSSVMTHFAQPELADDNQRLNVCDQLENDRADELTELDERFYTENENLVALTLSFAAKHINEFV